MIMSFITHCFEMLDGPPSHPTGPDPSRPHPRSKGGRCIVRIEQCIRELEAFDPQKVQKRYRVPEVMALEAAIDTALSAAFGHGTVEYRRYVDAATLDHGPHIAHLGIGFGEQQTMTQWKLTKRANISPKARNNP